MARWRPTPGGVSVVGGRYVGVMYSRNSNFQEPDASCTVWRYMDLARLVSILGNAALWFPRADQLSDSHEGAVGSLSRERFLTTYAKEWSPDVLRNVDAMNRELRSTVFISCWHLSEFESAAMWDIYANRSQGIAVRCAYGNLRESLLGDHDIFMSRVAYVDPDKVEIPRYDRPILTPFTYKRLSYSYESEVRAMIYSPPDRPTVGRRHDEGPFGISVPVNVEHLVSDVLVAPGLPTWYAQSVRMAVHAFAPTITVHQSSLDQDPVF